MIRRRLLPMLLAAPAVARHAAAQPDWPDRPLRFVIPFPAGNTADLAARAMVDGLARRLGQSVVIENRSGASGNIGVEAAAKARDGHTFLFTTSSPLVLSPGLYRSLPFDPLRDFVPIGRVGWIAVVLIGGLELPAGNLAALITHLRAQQVSASYASVGPGTFSHLAMELFRRQVGLEMIHVPYRGAGAAHADLLGGRVQLMFDSLASAQQQVQSGRLRGYAVTTTDRVPFAPDLPTLRESGLPGLSEFDITVWIGLFAPRDTPAPVAQRLTEALNAELANGAVRQRIEAQSITSYEPGPPEAVTGMLRRDIALWTRVTQEIGLDLT